MRFAGFAASPPDPAALMSWAGVGKQWCVLNYRTKRARRAGGGRPPRRQDLLSEQQMGAARRPEQVDAMAAGMDGDPMVANRCLQKIVMAGVEGRMGRGRDAEQEGVCAKSRRQQPSSSA
ncbi:hypothetical protein NDU88_012598 [Pleurodeles waltl]|uniref:Uncharacterized protein n=1 Tax=Pleurodeles waltl TaxID=8319 RepID=A0AAV7R4Y2_PLEWA|nr:hypothetical protein NDU88_012598 [Pleurodeles waltl]